MEAANKGHMMLVVVTGLKYSITRAARKSIRQKGLGFTSSLPASDDLSIASLCSVPGGFGTLDEF